MESTDFTWTIIWIAVGIFLLLIVGVMKGYDNPPSKTKIWTCETCNTKLKAVQIKFGLCPICGKKVKSFRGRHRGFL